MKTIDERKLETDAAYRYGYVAEFIGLDETDVRVIHDLAEHLAPLVPDLVDAVYDKLHSYSSTWRFFALRQDGYAGPAPASLAELTPDHPQIAFRKAHLRRYLERLVTAPYDAKMVAYLDQVGKIHTAAAGNPEIDIPLVEMNALLGFVSDAVTAALVGLDLPNERKFAAIRAFGKLMWVQNDLISRHYARTAH
jgi:hypothetical protein